VPVAHACNPSYSGGIRRIETLSWKNPSQKRAGGVDPGVNPEFKPQYSKKRKKSNLQKIDKNKDEKTIVTNLLPSRRDFNIQCGVFLSQIMEIGV
jgi:hypothetical protein